MLYNYVDYFSDFLESPTRAVAPQKKCASGVSKHKVMFILHVYFEAAHCN